VSLIDVIRRETPLAALRGKLVLVGATADGLGDRFPTPVSSNTEIMSGIELQANILDALLGDYLIRPAGLAASVVLSLLPLAALLVGFLRLRPWRNFWLGVGLMGATIGISLSLFSLGRIWWPPVTAVTIMALVFPIWSWRRLAAASAYLVEELSLFEAEADLLPRRPSGDPPRTTDVIDRQAWLVRDAIRRGQDLKRFMADTIAGLPDATLVIDRSEAIQIANLEAERLFARLAGVSPVGQPIGRLMDVLKPAFDRPRSPNATLDGEYESADDGWFHVRDIALRDAADGYGGRIVRFTDITEVKHAGRQRERVLQLLSHDMRSPQVSILAILGELKLAPTLPAERLKRIGDYARRTLALAEDFVQLARAENPHYALELLNASDVLVEAVDELWPQARARSITVVTVGCEDEFLVRADRSLLTRVFVNLIGNAIKYSEASSAVACSVSADGEPPSGVRVAIQDHGRGMSAEQLSRLFEPFQRALQIGQVRADGVGLGLAFVREVVKRHGGDVYCESRPDEGATFTVVLPLVEPVAGNV
jgi:signal transduction histidine kinase